jgi:inositol 2-dehydrogenase
MESKLNLALIGAGRMGRACAEYLAHRVPGAVLYAVADTRAEVAKSVAGEFAAARATADYQDVLADNKVDAVVVTTPSKLHKAVVLDAATAGKAIFCEKPLALALEDAEAIRDAVARNGVFFQLGFMRRFDAGYAAARRKVAEGAIGQPCVFNSSSKDKQRPDLEYLRPENSGGIFIDLGVHDFDLARWFMGEVESVYSTAGVLAYPEMERIGDWDNAITNLRFKNGCIGVISMSRNGVYGYGIHTEIVGTEGTIQIGYDRQTPILLMARDTIAYDTIPGFYERFENAYISQLQNFVYNLRTKSPAPVTCDDGIAAHRIALAATRSAKEGCAVCV